MAAAPPSLEKLHKSEYKPETCLLPVVEGKKRLGVDTTLHVMHSLHLNGIFHLFFNLISHLSLEPDVSAMYV